MLRNLFRTVNAVKFNTTRAMSTTSVMLEGHKYETFLVTSPKPFVMHVEMNRPEKLNTLNTKMWEEFGTVFNALSEDPDCRAIVLSGAGKIFTAGIDFSDVMALGQELGKHNDLARKGKVLESKIKAYQDSISALENCVKPIISAVHSGCIGAGVDIITAADIRYSTQDAWFQVKEVDIGMAADVGTLQRLPKVIGSQSLVRELCFTGRKFVSTEALSSGLVSRIFESKEGMISTAIELAETIAIRSPVAVQATKKNLNYSLSRTNQEGLDHIRAMNTYLLQSDDFLNAVMAQATSKGQVHATFEKL